LTVGNYYAGIGDLGSVAAVPPDNSNVVARLVGEIERRN